MKSRQIAEVIKILYRMFGCCSDSLQQLLKQIQHMVTIRQTWRQTSVGTVEGEVLNPDLYRQWQ